MQRLPQNAESNPRPISKTTRRWIHPAAGDSISVPWETATPDYFALRMEISPLLSAFRLPSSSCTMRFP